MPLARLDGLEAGMAQALQRVGKAQGEHQRNADPAERFIPLLLGALPALVGKLEALRPPLLRVEVDGEGVLVAVWPGREALEAHRRFPGMPCITPQEWVAGVLHRLAERYPNPNAVELLGQWPGQPPPPGASGPGSEAFEGGMSRGEGIETVGGFAMLVLRFRGAYEGLDAGT